MSECILSRRMDAKHVDSSQPNLLGAIAPRRFGATNLLFLVHSPWHSRPCDHNRKLCESSHITPLSSLHKSQLNTIHESEEDISCPTLPPTTLPTYTIINGMELIYSVGKPTSASNFWWFSRYRHSKHEIKLFQCLYQGGCRIWQIYITLHQTWFHRISCQRTTFTRTGKTLWTCQKIWGAYHFPSNQLIQYTF